MKTRRIQLGLLILKGLIKFIVASQAGAATPSGRRDHHCELLADRGDGLVKLDAIMGFHAADGANSFVPACQPTCF